MRRLLLLLPLWVAGGCATPDPAPRADRTPRTPTAAEASIPTAAPRTTSDPGTRYLPLAPLGGLAAETVPPAPAVLGPEARPPAGPAGPVGPVVADVELPVEDARSELPPPAVLPSQSADLGQPPTGPLPRPSSP